MLLGAPGLTRSKDVTINLGLRAPRRLGPVPARGLLDILRSDAWREADGASRERAIRRHCKEGNRCGIVPLTDDAGFL